MPTPPLFHGVDITPLEGWLTKYKSKGKFFGTSNKRWFKVNVTTADNASETQRLTLSYFKTKKATEVRGWIYLEDVTEVINKADVIEIVSPTRTLRLKGETAAEHRMWLESLRQLCFPQQPSPPRESAKQVDSTERHAAAKSTPSLDRADSQSKTASSSPEPREPTPAAVAYTPARHDPPPEAKAEPSEAKLHAKPAQPLPDVTDDSAAKQPDILAPPRAETKSASEEVAEAKPPLKPRGSVLDLKPRDESQNALEFSDSEDSDEEDDDAKASARNSDCSEQQQPAPGPFASARDDPSPSHAEIEAEKRDVDSFTGSNNASVDAKHVEDDDDDDATEVERFESSPQRPAPKPASDYFDDDAADSPKKPASPPKPAPSSTVRADNNFVTEDWDEDVQPVVTKVAVPPPTGVAADANFVTEDWD